MKTLSRFRAKSISGSGDIDRGHKKPPPDLQGSKKPRLNRVKGRRLHEGGVYYKIQRKLQFYISTSMISSSSSNRKTALYYL